MKPSTTPNVPPALRKANPRKAADISSAFPPIVPRPRPVESIPLGETPPTVSDTGEKTLPVSGGSTQHLTPTNTSPKTIFTQPSTPFSKPSTPPAPSQSPGNPPTAPVASPAARPAPISRPSQPLTRPKPVITGRPPVAKLDGKVVLFEGSFRPEGFPAFIVETKLTGNAAKDKQSLINLARKKYPTGRMSLASTRIVTREVNAVTSFTPGTTLGQLFGEAGSPTEVAVELGSVFFDSAICQIFLRNLRSRNCVTFSLRQPNGGSVNFSNQIQSNRLAKELPIILREILGNKARELKVTLKEEAK